ncbi:hypothetical protein A1Q1_08176 [Trichosporon asahii var. asahii CBS 2479]|uniref:Required for respiratory growth protein 9, mitochondrial n=1 Tax=Trichosporon asahii var. asahii (strain ATCC 90039 / CBS 2479 / JCM 2466 / KCTC 7840 / NBRC 103889/ NCYC 2677 / UAMH 7654) TaxID=1186058 RepID=J6F118_TRIAS|nr:hypothetical protein A1Q1_08176 [Trichosporon asahii var. asahii CBS 2479]EJT50624.1 hypothetical protein A1Q1_08176 [Trichosporon asahii var. asahii CBS 2479]
MASLLRGSVSGSSRLCSTSCLRQLSTAAGSAAGQFSSHSTTPSSTTVGTRGSLPETSASAALTRSYSDYSRRSYRDDRPRRPREERQGRWDNDRSHDERRSDYRGPQSRGPPRDPRARWADRDRDQSGRPDRSPSLSRPLRGADDPAPSSEPSSSTPKRRWNPTKKLTHATMSAIRELHRQDPEQWSKPALSKQFGVSYEAIGRILKSNWREKEAAKAAPASTAAMAAMKGGSMAAPGKWSLGDEEGMTIAETTDPAAFVRKAYEMKRKLEAERREEERD